MPNYNTYTLPELISAWLPAHDPVVAQHIAHRVDTMHALVEFDPSIDREARTHGPQYLAI